MISIPCGLHIYDREIEFTLRVYDTDHEVVDLHFGEQHVCSIRVTDEISKAIDAHVEYEKSIKDVGVESRD